jgi:hypothetical protein
VTAGMKELNEMTIGRTDDPENPLCGMAFEAASLFGTGSRTPSGPAVMAPHEQAGHMIAIDLPVRLTFLLHPRGRPHMPQRVLRPTAMGDSSGGGLKLHPMGCKARRSPGCRRAPPYGRGGAAAGAGELPGFLRRCRTRSRLYRWSG